YLKQPHPIEAEPLEGPVLLHVRLPPIYFKPPGPGPEPINVGAAPAVPVVASGYAATETKKLEGTFSQRWPSWQNAPNPGLWSGNLTDRAMTQADTQSPMSMGPRITVPIPGWSIAPGKTD